MKPTEMELRVARALHPNWFSPHHEIVFPVMEWRKIAIKQARAAIQAMRGDPGHDVTGALCKPGDNRTKFVEIWQAMINAASPTTDGDK